MMLVGGKRQRVKSSAPRKDDWRERLNSPRFEKVLGVLFRLVNEGINPLHKVIPSMKALRT